MVRHPARWWLLSFAVWTLACLLAVLEHQMKPAGPDGSTLVLLAHWLPGYYVAALLSPLVFLLADRWPLAAGAGMRRWLTHAGLSALFACAYGVLHSLVICFFWPHASLLRHVRKMLLEDFRDGIIAYWVALLAAHALRFYLQARERELAAAKLEARLRTAELETLRMQLNPHFLFNTLNTLAVLIREDRDAAGDLLVRVSDLLRSILGKGTGQEIALREELALLDNYLEIERARFGTRLVVERQIDPRALDAAVPMFLLQPLVENAIRHGISRLPRAGTLSIAATCAGERLLLEIANDGDGVAGGSLDPASSRGIGLRNTVARLDRLYGSDHEVRFEAAGDGGATVRIAIPLSCAEVKAIA